VEAKLRAKHSVVTLFDETAVLAKREDKTPVVSLAEKCRPGFWIMCRPEDLAQVAAEMVSQKSQFEGYSDLLL